ncbi:MAG: hypothetical protein WB612_01180 [Nitrososphaeraceae archaeon]
MKKNIAMQNTREKLSLADISPVWHYRLYEHTLPLPFSLTWLKWYFELKVASKCVVGEAYKYDSTYLVECSRCDYFGWKFMIYFTLRSRSKLEKNKNAFLVHWINEHLRLS